MNTKRIAIFTLACTVLAEIGLALKVWQRWPELHKDGYAGAYQAAAATLIGWPTVVFAFAATFAAFRSAQASERQAIAADRQAAAADAQKEVALETLKEQLRPNFSLERTHPSIGWDAAGQRVVLKNVGSGSAYNLAIEFFRDRTTDIYIGTVQYSQINVVPPGALCPFPAVPEMFKSMTVFYTDKKGEAFCTDFSLYTAFFSSFTIECASLPKEVRTPRLRKLDHANPQTDEEYEASNNA